MRLAPPRLPPEWTEERCGSGAVRLRLHARSREEGTPNTWTLPLLGALVFYSCFGFGLVFGEAWWLPLALVLTVWLSRLLWLSSATEVWEITGTQTEVQSTLWSIPLQRCTWGSAEFQVAGPVNGTWELWISGGGDSRRLYRSESLDTVLELSSYLQTHTDAPVNYVMGIRNLFPRVLDLAFSSQSTSRWRLLFEQPLLFPSFAEAVRDPERRARVLVALRRLEAGQPRLLEALHGNSEGPIRAAALELLTELDDRTVLPRVRTLLNDADITVRAQAVACLGRLRDVEAVPTLCALLSGEFALVHPAITALASIGDPRAVPALCALVRSTYLDQRSDLPRAVAVALGQIRSPGALSALELVLRQSAPGAREAAAGALGQIGDPSALTVLCGALGDREPEVRIRAAESLGLLGLPKAVPALATLLYDRSVPVRMAAVTALVRIGDSTAIHELIRVLENSEFLVRREAAIGLGQLAPCTSVLPLHLRAAVPVLQRLCSDRSNERSEVKRACLDALQRIEERMGQLKGLPVPAGPGEPSAHILPRPSSNPFFNSLEDTK